jgi:hypothetical protein
MTPSVAAGVNPPAWSVDRPDACRWVGGWHQTKRVNLRWIACGFRALVRGTSDGRRAFQDNVASIGIREKHRASMSPSRSTLRTLAWWTVRALGAVLLSLAASEGALRLASAWLPGARLLAEPSGRRARDPQSFAEFQRAFSAHLVPFRERYGFRANSLGFHDVEFAPRSPEGAFRVVALGDSFAYGHVPYGHAHLTIAEGLIVHARQRRAAGAAPLPFTIDNLGVPASGLADYELVYDFVGRALEPDLVLVNLYLGNDPQDFADPSRFGRQAKRPRSYLLTFLARTTTLARERWRAGADVAPQDASPESRARTFRDQDPELARPEFSDAAFADIVRNELRMITLPGTEPGLPDWDAFIAALDHLVARIETDGTPAVLVLAPSRLQVQADELRAARERAGLAAAAVDPELPARRIAAYAADRGLPVIDLTPALRRAAAGGRLYRVNDTHWSLRGNAIAAAELALQLAERGLVPLAEGDGPGATAGGGQRSLPAPSPMF